MTFDKGIAIDPKELDATFKRFEQRLDKVLNKSGILGNINLEATLTAYQKQAENSAKLHHERMERIAREQTSWEKKHNMRVAASRQRQLNEMIMRTMSGGGAGAILGGAQVVGGAGISGGQKLGGRLKGMLGGTNAGKGLRYAMGDTGALDSAIMGGDSSAKDRDKQSKVAQFFTEHKFGKIFTKSMKAANKVGGGLQKNAAGIGAGLGIAGMIGGGLITKAIEASPIAQSMMKIMSTAFTLILRPIGDFFGGFLKPISIRLLKWGADNVGSGEGMFKMGKELAAHVIGFFSSPTDYLSAVISDALASMYNLGVDLISPILSTFGKTEEEIAAMKLETNGLHGYLEQYRTDLDGFGSMVTDASMMVTSSAAEDMAKLGDKILNELPDAIAESEKKTYTNQDYADIYGQSGKEGQQWVHENIDKESWWWKNIGSLSGQVDPIGGKADEPTIGEGAYVGDALKVEELTKESREILAHYEAYNAGLYDMTELNNAQLENYQTYIDTVTDEMATHQEILDAGKAYAKAQNETVYNQNDYNSLTDGQNTTLRTITDELLLINGEFERIRAEVEKIKIRAPRGMSPGGSGGGGMAGGGVIQEPIWGIGQSGRSYLFGETGAERVTPINGGGSGGDNVTINIKIDSIGSDVDLQKIKPIVERALRESHSRRGII
jgi:hypothetical protein